MEVRKWKIVRRKKMNLQSFLFQFLLSFCLPPKEERRENVRCVWANVLEHVPLSRSSLWAKHAPSRNMEMKFQRTLLNPSQGIPWRGASSFFFFASSSLSSSLYVSHFSQASPGSVVQVSLLSSSVRKKRWMSSSSAGTEFFLQKLTFNSIVQSLDIFPFFPSFYPTQFISLALFSVSWLQVWILHVSEAIYRSELDCESLIQDLCRLCSSTSTTCLWCLRQKIAIPSFNDERKEN